MEKLKGDKLGGVMEGNRELKKIMGNSGNNGYLWDNYGELGELRKSFFDTFQMFYNCSCFLTNSTSHAVDGRCDSECNIFPLFAVGAVLLMFFTFMNNVPLLNATFRYVYVVE